MSSSISTVDLSLSPPENTSDVFNRLPDHIILTILNNISDIKTLTRFRTVSHRFNSLVPQSDSLTLRVDRVISTVDSDNHHDNTPSVIGFIISVMKSIQNLISPPDHVPSANVHQPEYSPAMILRGFDRIKELNIELPNGDLWLEKRAAIKWNAEYGKSLKSCVIIGHRCGGISESELGGGGGLKTRVVWTISALIAASTRHNMVKGLVSENVHLSRLIVYDKEQEGRMFMDESGIKEYRECVGNEENEEEGQNGNINSNSNSNSNNVWWSGRTRVPAVWVRMWYEGKLELSNGLVMEGATLVVVRPSGDAGGVVEDGWDELVAAGGGFDGVYGEAVEKLIKRRSYFLEMNSF